MSGLVSLELKCLVKYSRRQCIVVHEMGIINHILRTGPIHQFQFPFGHSSAFQEISRPGSFPLLQRHSAHPSPQTALMPPPTGFLETGVSGDTEPSIRLLLPIAPAPALVGDRGDTAAGSAHGGGDRSAYGGSGS